MEPDAPAPGFSLHIPARLVGFLVLGAVFIILASLASWSVDDPSFSYATDKSPSNWLGYMGAFIADLGFQVLGIGALLMLVPPLIWGWRLARRQMLAHTGMKLMGWIGASILGAGVFSCIAVPQSWPLPTGLGGLIGSAFTGLAGFVIGHDPQGAEAVLYSLILVPPTLALLWLAISYGAPKHAPSQPETEADFAPDPQDAQHNPETDTYRTNIFDVVVGGCAHLIFRSRIAWKNAVQKYGNSAEKADMEWARATAAQQDQHAVPHNPDVHNPDVYANPQDAQAQSYQDADFNDGAFQEQERIEPVLDGGPTNAQQEPVLDFPEEAYLADYDEVAEADHHAQDFQPAPQETAAQPVADSTAQRIVESGPTAPSNNANRIAAPAARPQPGARQAREAQGSLLAEDGFELPELSLLAPPLVKGPAAEHSADKLEENARRLEGVLEDFGVKGDIINVRPGPVVTLYELEPAPGIKSSRVISLADDIARSMSAISARVAVVPGRNAIGIELPNQTRETVYLREMLASSDFEKMKGKLNICLGKTIGGEPVIADLARMPHLLVAGTTGSGKSVAINTMILSLLYRLTPEQCRLIMIDPKMLELSVYDGIPHLLTPVVTDPSKAVVALKWAVREMEDRYKKMSKIGVRNIDGFNQRVSEAAKKGETISRTVQTGFDRETGGAIFESEEFSLETLPYIVIIIDEMADLMMVAGKDIEGTVQRLAQMARAAGIHVVMATQRPSVDVITGTIKANFPTRISFQVTSKIDSRTILGEMGAEQLLGMGDMLYMAGGGRIRRLHGPFCADSEVEDVVAHLKMQGAPDYLETITREEEEEGDGATGGLGNTGDELYDKAVNIVLADKKASTSYIQRRLSIGYNRAATLIEKMEREGVISAANHAGKREILVGDGVDY
jgi:S-DNA-T family DNA segregation ATPase FtsK/SpoIIIE